MRTEFAVRAIGVIRSPFRQQANTPIQASRSEAQGKVEVFPEYEDGLEDLEGFSHIFLLYLFHCSVGYSLHVKPFLDDRERGLFATRHPCRPNPIGMSVVGLTRRCGNVLEVSGIDVLDATPLLDIKPYVPEFDVRLGSRAGWLTSRSRQV
jgi:tRNA (adenine37-N6)-methyltransferase